MKTLLNKEMKLTASPLSFLFIAFAVMTFIPGYPILLAGFFVCFGIFHSFQAGREAGDILYTAMLPVEKADVVRAKFAFTVSIQLVAFTVTALFTVLRMTLLSQAGVYLQNALMNANLAYLGYILLVYAAFNTLFVQRFFKTAYAIGIPFLLFGIACFLLIGITETLHFLPHCGGLNRAGFEKIQLIPFFFGAAVYPLSTLLAQKKSVAAFEKLDL